MTKEELRKLLTYDLLTGEFTWNVTRGGLAVAGSPAGSRIPEGYKLISVKGRIYMASRLAFMYVLGRWPHNLVDHINEDKKDDRWINLRDATEAQNRRNTGHRANNKLGVKNVCMHGSRFMVQVAGPEGKYVDTFPTLEQATDMAKRMRQILHGDFAK